VFALGCVAASIAFFVIFEVGGVNTLRRFGFFEKRFTRPDLHVCMSVSRHNAHDRALGVSVSFELQS
jgi:hypothetical protein